MSEKQDSTIIYSSSERSSVSRKSVAVSGTPSTIITPSGHRDDIVVDADDVSVLFNLSTNREAGVKEYFINLIKGKVRMSWVAEILCSLWICVFINL